MKDLKIGNLLITKKGLLTLAYVFFLTGAILGGTLLTNHSGTKNLFFIIPFLAFIWFKYIPTLKREIKELPSKES